jgi:predicted permease
MRTLIQDLRFATRTFVKTPGFTVVVILSIALGIAANTTVFSVVNGLMFGAIPVKDPERLMMLGEGSTMSWPNYADLRDQSKDVMAGLAASFPLVPAGISGVGQPERVWGQLVTGNYFEVAGVRPVLGRPFLPEEDQVDGRNPVVILAYSLWQRRFGADPAIAGKTVLLNGLPYTVVGVAPAGFTGTTPLIVGEFWTPIAMAPQLMPDLAKEDLKNKRDAQWLFVEGRLKNGVSKGQATVALNVIRGRINQAWHKDGKNGLKPVVLTQSGRLPSTGGAAGLTLVMMAIVSMVLLIACANVANLMLARGASRSREFGIRLSIGASRWRLVRQLLTESALLALCGAAIGYSIAVFAARALSSFRLPIFMPIVFDFTPGANVLAYTIGLSFLAAVLFGLVPALRSTRIDLASGLRDRGQTLGSLRWFGLRNALVVVQVSLSLVLLICSGLFVRSLRNASSVDLGMSSENLLMVGVDPKTNNYKPERTRQFLAQLRERVAAIPGVEKVSFIDSVPLSMGGVDLNATTEDSKGGKREADVDVYRAGRGYFDTIGIRMLRGRDFDLRDGNRMAVINEKTAKELFPAGDAVGRTLRVDLAGQASYEVIGVVRNAKSRTLGEEPRACLWLSLEADPEKAMSFFGISTIVKTHGSPRRFERAVRDQIAALDRTLAITSAETMQERVDKALLLPRISATLLGLFGLIGLALATVGLYGVLSFVVRTRTREIGIRMALGAQRNSVLAMIAGQGLALTVAGLAIGLGIAAALTRFATAFLYGIGAHDPVTFIGVPLVLMAAALVAILAPARRASAIEPLQALRYE